jgi:hypothetical protein
MFVYVFKFVHFCQYISIFSAIFSVFLTVTLVNMLSISFHNDKFLTLFYILNFHSILHLILLSYLYIDYNFSLSVSVFIFLILISFSPFYDTQFDTCCHFLITKTIRFF